MRARIYVRVSTDEQAESGHSLAAQTHSCEAFCASQGWPVAGVYIDDGYSAKDLERPHLQRLLAEVQDGDVVVTWRLDRLTRRVLDLYTLLNGWDAQNVKFRSVTEVFDTTTAIGRLFLTLVAALAQWERENIGERTKAGQLQAAREGKRNIGTQPKYGYDFTDGITIVEAEAAAIRQMEEWYLAGDGLRRICQKLNYGGYPPLRSGKPWHLRAVTAILTDERYTGTLIYNQRKRVGKKLRLRPEHEWVRTPDVYPAIRTVERQRELDAVRAAKGSYEKRGVPGRAAGSPYLLSGLLRCSECGTRMHHNRHRRGARPGGAAPSYYRVYYCNRAATTATCQAKEVDAKRVEESVLEYMRQHGIREYARRAIRKELVKPDVPSRLTSIDGMLERHYQAYLHGSITLEKYDAERLKLEGQRSAILAESHRTTDTEARELVASKRRHQLEASAIDILSSGDVGRIKTHLLATVDHIVCGKGGVIVHLRD